MARAVRAAAVVWSTLVGVTSIARAEDIEGFERAMDRGHAELDRSQYEAALSAFIDASHLSECPTGLLWAGKASEKIGRKAEAFEFYERAAHQKLGAEALTPCVRAKADADAAATTLRTQLGTLDVTVLGLATPLTHVELNTRQRAIAAPAKTNAASQSAATATERFEIVVDPGKYSLAVAGAAPVTGTIAAGETKSVQVDLTPASKPASSAAPPETVPPKTGPQEAESEKADSQATSSEETASETTDPLEAKTAPPASNPPASTSVWKWTAFGVGSAGAIVAVTSFLVVNRKVDTLTTLLERKDCDQWCRQDYTDTRAEANTWATVGNIGGAVGAVGFGAWLWLFATDPKPSETQTSAVRWSLTPTSAAVAVEW